MSNALTIGASAIRELDGLYSLNDLHKASGGDKSKQPANFIRLDTTQALLAELNSSDLRSLQTSTGRHGGTFVCRELVIAYAAWISPAFNLKVIRVFLNTTTTTTLTSEQQHLIKSAIAAKCKSNPKAYSDCYHALYHAFNVPRYQDIPATRFEAALSFVKSWGNHKEQKEPIQLACGPIGDKVALGVITRIERPRGNGFGTVYVDFGIIEEQYKVTHLIWKELTVGQPVRFEFSGEVFKSGVKKVEPLPLFIPVNDPRFQIAMGSSH
jgi:hypothetical protein